MKKTFWTLLVSVVLLYALFTVGFPFLIALVVAVLLEPLVQWLMRVFKLGRTSAAATACTAFTLFISGLLYLIGLKIYRELLALWDYSPRIIENIQTALTEMSEKSEGYMDSLPKDIAPKIEKWLESSSDSLGSVGGISTMFLSFAKAIPNMLIFTIVLLVAIYLFSISLPRMRESFLLMFEPSSRPKMESVLGNLKDSIFGFLRAQIILSTLTYLITLGGFLILGVKYALAIALLVVIVDILPILGTGSFLVPWAVYHLVMDDVFVAVGLIVLFIVITIFRRAIEPKILGDAVGIGALPALISLYIGFQLVGVIGLFLGPIVVIVYQAMRNVGLLHYQIKLE